jgi:hypothetical protein
MPIGVQYAIVDLTSYGPAFGRMTMMKHTRKINQETALHHPGRNPHALDAVHDPTRIQGGNWTMQGCRRSGHVYDEDECQMSIAEFMADTQERRDLVE